MFITCLKCGRGWTYVHYDEKGKNITEEDFKNRKIRCSSCGTPIVSELDKKMHNIGMAKTKKLIHEVTRIFA